MELQMPKQSLVKQAQTLFMPELRSRTHPEKRQRRRSHQKPAEMNVLEQPVDEVVYIQQPMITTQSFVPTYANEKEQVILLQEPVVKTEEAVLVQQEILPQEVVIVSYNGEEVPSETGIIAYDENGQVLLIRESDIKTVDSYKNQHFIHTFDGTTYIIDSNTETTAVEPTYIVLDKQDAAANPFVLNAINVSNMQVASSDSTVFGVESTSETYGFQNWNDVEIYQAMTAFRIAETSETNSVLTQTPIMSTVETPSCVRVTPIEYKFNKKPNETLYTSQSLEDTLAKIGVLPTGNRNIPPALQLPATVTDPTITSSILNVTSAEEDDNDSVYANNDFWQ